MSVSVLAVFALSFDRIKRVTEKYLKIDSHNIFKATAVEIFFI